MITDGRIRVGLLGFGFAGQTFHTPLILACRDLHLVAVASRDSEKVRSVLPDAVVFADAVELAVSPQVDLVVVATPNETHAPLARLALRAGKSVVIDKPFTLDLAEARDLITLAQTHGGLLSVFHNRRWDSDYLTIRDLIAQGAVGKVAHFESHFDRFRPELRDRWRERPGRGSGVWFDLGPHLVDQALQLFGLPDHVVASLSANRPGGQTDDWAHVILEYAGRRIILHASMLVAGGSARFIVHGDGGSAIKSMADRQEAQLIAGMRPGDETWGDDPDDAILFGPDGGSHRRPAIRGDQRHYYDAIAATLRGAGPNPVRPVEALAVMAVVDAALRSSAGGMRAVPDLSAAERQDWQGDRAPHGGGRHV